MNILHRLKLADVGGFMGNQENQEVKKAPSTETEIEACLWVEAWKKFYFNKSFFHLFRFFPPKGDQRSHE